jgi:hypothetical protein
MRIVVLGPRVFRPRVSGIARGHGADQTRWPIAYFDALGLFNLHAHLATYQSSRR